MYKKKMGITGLIVSGAADVKSNHCYFLHPPEGVSAEPSVPDADPIVPLATERMLAYEYGKDQR